MKIKLQTAWCIFKVGQALGLMLFRSFQIFGNGYSKLFRIFQIGLYLYRVLNRALR